jgi:hypothetical protein
MSFRIATDLDLEMKQRVFKEQHDIFIDLNRQE